MYKHYVQWGAPECPICDLHAWHLRRQIATVLKTRTALGLLGALLMGYPTE